MAPNESPLPRRLAFSGRTWELFGFVLAGLVVAGGLTLLLAAPFLPALNESLVLQVGEVALAGIQAPRPITYTSEALTEAAREAAEASAAEVFAPPDARIGRAQVESLRAALTFIDNVRADSYASPEQKTADLGALSRLQLDGQIVDSLMLFTSPDWEAVRGEAVRVLDQVMRGPVREDRVLEALRSLPTLVSVELNEPQAQAVTGLVAGFVTPNSLHDAGATAAARAAARSAVAPVIQTFVAGQTVVGRGDVLTQAQYEALGQLGLMAPDQDRQRVLTGGLAALLAVGILALFFVRFMRGRPLTLRQAALFCGLVLIFVLVARVIVPGRTLLPYLFPAGTLAIMLAVIYGPALGVVTSVIVAALAGYLAGNSLEMAVYAGAGGVLAALSVGRAERLGSFFRSGLAVAVGNILVLMIFRLADGNTDTMGLLTLLGASLFNGVSATFSLPLLFVLGFFFDVTTSLHLIELSRPDHPLLQFILRSAPGTYQHSLQVANLAEQAAERIGANALLTRVGALYHDCGKALHPQFFVENQSDGENIHEHLDPQTSGKIVIGHVSDGLKMATRHRLPSRIRDFIPEHHGTLVTRFQFARAVEAAGGDETKVNRADFTYPGPRPRSRETALLMLADACESSSRANRPANVQELERLVKRIVDDRVAQGQLDETDLTLRDLQLVRESFVNTMKGQFHARLQYPEDKPAIEQAQAPLAASPVSPRPST